MDDEQTWGALDKEALRKIRVRVEEWRDVMNISLIFIALFLTVVTTFISPIISLFTSPTADSSKNPLPPVSTQFVALFYYLALMVSVFNSVLCVLGMQWAARLIATPLGNTNLERTLARERRAAVAEGYMLSLMGILVWTLLLSIGFFVLGFLIQLWEIAVSFTGRAPILLFGGAFATGLSVIIMGIIVVTTFHAALHNNSPFESPLSNLLQPFLRWSRYILPQEFGSDEKDNNDVDLEKKGQNDNEDQGEYPDEWEGGQNTPETDAVEDVEALVRWQKSDPEGVQALKAYARLVINATDMEVLERAVPSFEFGEWHKAGMSLSPIFMAVRDRFLATDTSFRLKETVNQQLVYFKDWKGWCNHLSPVNGNCSIH
ncbi:hypothetical protein SISNIDRAFT_179696 [Sistotremastrum niveocremeum HHB9708]|uniref:DUF6535 domain-containing protein n=1 Tax=Sistotremastrum niveocremeum HHB9708 TaxID=1314777 RepID=A0A164RCE8_9AGAM|nr:hypothetical protein SISNIDRAFT_179696 [Sistotremastrum niveocremeum HHB9708]